MPMNSIIDWTVQWQYTLHRYNITNISIMIVFQYPFYKQKILKDRFSIVPQHRVNQTGHQKRIYSIVMRPWQQFFKQYTLIFENC